MMKSFLQKWIPFDPAKTCVFALLVLWISATFSMALMQISFVIALVLWILACLKRPQLINWISSSFTDRLMAATLLAFFLFVLASFFVSEYPKQSFRGVFKIAKPLLVFFMTADLFRNDSNRRRFDLAFVITLLLVTVDSSVQYAFGKSLLRGFPAQDSSAGLRIVGPFGDFGRMSAYLILVIPVFVMQFWARFRNKETRRSSIWQLLLALIAFTLLYLTRCRGPVVALLGAFFILFLCKRWFKAIGIGILLFLALLAMTPRGMIIHLDAESKEQSLVERVELWRRALDVIDSRPWLGTGINTYNVAHEKYDTQQNWRVRGYYAHNGYLQLAAEIGIPGILCFLLFLFVFFIRGFRNSNSVRGSPEELSQLGILTGLLAFLIYALADTNLQSPQSLMSFWFMAGILMAHQAASSETQKEKAAIK